MTILATATDPADYVGWGGTGAAVYSGTISSGTSFTNAISINYNAEAANTIGFGRGCLWLGFASQSGSLGFAVAYSSSGARGAAGISTAPLVFHTSDSTHFIVFRPRLVGSGTTSLYELYTTTDLLDTAQYTLIGSYSTTTYNTILWMSVDITGIGTTSGRITICSDAWAASTFPVGTIAIDTYVDLSGFSDISAVSYHAPDPATSSWYVYGTVISDISLRAARMNVFIPTTANGTYTEWSGSVTAFTTYPTVYTNYGTGFYSTEVGMRITFGKRADVTETTGYEIRGIVIGANIRGGLESPTATAPYLFNPTTTADYTGTSISSTPAGAGNVWLWNKDPITGKKWQISDYSEYEFGMIRTA